MNGKHSDSKAPPSSKTVTIGLVQAVAEAAWGVLNHDNDPHDGQSYNTKNWHDLTRAIRNVLQRRFPDETNGVRESALQRVIDRHVRWRKTAIGFLRQVVDGRGSEDEWPALAEFLERSDSRMAERSVEKRAACDERDMKPLLSAPLTVEDRRVWRQVERRMVGKWVRAVLRGGNHLDHLSYTGIYAKADFCDAELMLNVTLYPHMLVTALAQEMNPNFKMPRPLARMAGQFCRVFSAT